MKTLTLKLSLIITSLMMLTCESQPSNNTIGPVDTDAVITQRLDISAFKEKLAKTTNALLLDVRTPEEYQKGAIPNARNIDYYGDDFEATLKQLNLEQPTFVYCRSGGRSGKTLKLMRTLGFKEVYELKSGYNSWK